MPTNDDLPIIQTEEGVEFSGRRRLRTFLVFGVALGLALAATLILNLSRRERGEVATEAEPLRPFSDGEKEEALAALEKTSADIPEGDRLIALDRISQETNVAQEEMQDAVSSLSQPLN